MKTKIFTTILTLLFAALSAAAQDTLQTRPSRAQLKRELSPSEFLDSLAHDSLRRVEAMKAAFDSIASAADAAVMESVSEDSVALQISDISGLEMQDGSLRFTIDDKRFVPDSKKAMWLAIAFPGGGQIYNRKYWKLPLIYGGFLGCVYALNWNNTMYRDYSQAYVDIMDDDPGTKSYENFLPPNYDVNQNLSRIQNLLRRKKDYYRRYRDLSLFCMIGVYALSIIDAYVDAELSSFDLSRDLSMKVRPSIITDRSALAARMPHENQSYGVRCSLSF